MLLDPYASAASDVTRSEVAAQLACLTLEAVCLSNSLMATSHPVPKSLASTFVESKVLHSL